MAYTPPAGDSVNFDFTESGYSPPAGGSVLFELGAAAKEVVLAAASEAEQATPVKPGAREVRIDAAHEAEAATTIRPTRFVPIGQAQDQEAAGPVKASKYKAISAAQSQESAGALSIGKAITVAPAQEDETAPGILAGGMSYEPPAGDSVNFDFTESGYSPPAGDNVVLDLISTTYEAEPKRTVAALYSAPHGRTRARDNRRLQGWAGTPRDGARIRAPHKAHQRRLAETYASGYQHTFERTTEVLGLLDFRPRKVENTRSRFGKLPGPPSGSPRNDPEVAAPYREAKPTDDATPATYGRLDYRTGDTRARWDRGKPADPQTRAPYGDPLEQTRGLQAPWVDPRWVDDTGAADWGGAHQPADALQRTPYRYPPPRDRTRRQPWTRPRAIAGQKVAPLIYPPPKDLAPQAAWGPIPAGVICRPIQTGHPDPTELVIEAGAPREEIDEARSITPPGEAPIGETAVAWSNTLTAYRTSDGAAVPIEAVTITTDQDSFCWSFDATMPTADAKRVMPTEDGPGELTLEVNGERWDVLVEGYSLNRDHGRTKRRLSGRTLAAWLDRPHAPMQAKVQADPANVRQLADQEIDGTDYTIDWHAADWYVPAGNWGYKGKPPIKAIARIAQAAGAFVYDSPAGKGLTVRPRYPVSPPDWLDAGAREFPVSLVTRAAGRWQRDPRRSLAWVTGETADGVAVRCYRPRWHTQGDQQPPVATVNDALITEPVGGRARGQAEIDATGPKLIDTITVPLGDPLDLIEPGEMLRIFDAAVRLTGLVRGVRVEARMQDGAVTASQTVDLETRPEGFDNGVAAGSGAYEPADGANLEANLTEQHNTGEVCETRPASGPRDRGLVIPAPSGIIDPVEA